MGHYGRKEVKFGDAGDAKMISFEVTDATKLLMRTVEKRNGGTLRGRELHPECERRQDSNEEEGGST